MFWIDKAGPTDGFKLQAEEFVLDLIGHVGSLEGIYYEKKSQRKMNMGALPGYKNLW